MNSSRYNTRSEPLGPSRPAEAETRRQRTPAMVPRGCVISAAIGMLRIIAVLLLGFSTFGNYVQFVGGWPEAGKNLPIVMSLIAGAVVYQAVCSVLQWGFKAMRWWLPYGIALFASAAPSFLTYNGLFGPYLAAQVGSLLAVVAVLVAVVGGDALPEWVLVE